MSTLHQVILQALRHGEAERFTLDLGPAHDQALAAALSGRSAAAELSEVLRLVVALEETLGSPAAAESLRAWLRRSPGARAVLGQLFGVPGGIDAARGFAEREGRGSAPRAATFGAAAPAGTVSARTFLDPLRSERPRAPRPTPVRARVTGR